MAVFIVGVTVENGYEIEKDVTMEPGETATLAGYRFEFKGVDPQRGPNYRSDRAMLIVTTDSGRAVTTLRPERRVYTEGRNTSPMTEAAIHTGLTRDLYVALGDRLTEQRWIVRLYYKPYVDWIWGGCLLMALGGFIAVLDRRYRLRRRTSHEPQPAPTPARPVAAAARTGAATP